MSGASFTSTYSCEHLPNQPQAICACRVCSFQIPVPCIVFGLDSWNLCCQTLCDTVCSLSCKTC